MNTLGNANAEPTSTRWRRSTKRATAPKRVGGVAGAVMTEAEYRDLIQKHVDQARADQSVAERTCQGSAAALRNGDRRADGDGMMATTRTRRRRATGPKPVRQVARAARLSLEKLAEAIVAGQPSAPTPREHTALLRWLAQSIATANPGIGEDELAEHVVARLREMAEAGDKTAKAVIEAPVWSSP